MSVARPRITMRHKLWPPAHVIGLDGLVRETVAVVMRPGGHRMEIPQVYLPDGRAADSLSLADLRVAAGTCTWDDAEAHLVANYSPQRITLHCTGNVMDVIDVDLGEDFGIRRVLVYDSDTYANDDDWVNCPALAETMLRRLTYTVHRAMLRAVVADVTATRRAQGTWSSRVDPGMPDRVPTGP